MPQPPHRILLINGPNLNLLGTREPQVYGSTTLPDVVAAAAVQCASHRLLLESFQSNHEGAIVDRIQQAGGFDPSSSSSATTSATSATSKVSAIVINPGAFTHTSVAIRDALLSIDVPFVEVHVSNVHARDDFRRRSYLSDQARAVICGLGVYGYEAAIEFVARGLREGRL